MPTVSRSTPTFDPHPADAPHTPAQQRPAPSNTGSRPAPSPLLVNLAPRAPGGATPSLTGAGRQLAGYLRGRVALNKVVDGTELDDLQSGQASLTKTRADLAPANKTNASTPLDLDAYATHNTAIALGKQLFTALQNPDKPSKLRDMVPFQDIKAIGGDDPDRYFTTGQRMIAVACGLYAKKGVCDVFSRTGIARHGPQLRDGQTVAVMESDSPFPHSWMQVRDPRPGRQDIVHDGWADGPAVLAEDSRRTSGDHEPPAQNGAAFNQAESRIFAQGVAKLLIALRRDPGIGAVFQKMQTHEKAKLDAFVAHPDGGVDKLMGLAPPMPTVSDAFIGEVESAVRRQT